MEGQYITLYRRNVSLEIMLKEDLSTEGINSANFVIDNYLRSGPEPVSWDNLRFFLERKEKRVKRNCIKDVEKLGLEWGEIWEDIKYLLERAKKLKYIDEARNR